MIFGFILAPSLVSLWFLVTQIVANMAPSHGEGLKKDQILVGYSCHFCATSCMTLTYLAGTRPFRSEGLVVVGSVQSTFLYQRQIGAKALAFSVFSELCRCCLQQWGLFIQFVESYP